MTGGRDTGHVRLSALVVVALALLAGVVVATPSGAQPIRTLDLRVLVIATGTPDTDVGLDLIDDVLDEVGVRYDVLDASVDILDESTLSDGSHGFYNGIIITESELFVPPDESAFTPVEWQVLHDYERTFGVREAIIGGAPTGDPSRGLDYGMGNVTSGSGFSGAWVGPAGTELFSYVNTATNLEVTDFAFLGVPRNDGVGPAVTPLLVDAANPASTLVSHLQYADGREVLLSTITNAWFLVHSQVLAYEFVDFATRGIHLGARRVYLNSHIDDLFLGSALWDPDENISSDENPYRNTAADIETAVAAQRRLNEEHSSLDGFEVEFAFNAVGSGRVPRASFPMTADAMVSSTAPLRRHGRAGSLRALSSNGADSRILARFDLTDLGEAPVEVASLRLVGAAQLDGFNGSVCRLTQQWDEAEVTWSEATAGVAWDGGDGPAVDAASCVSFSAGDGLDLVDAAGPLRDWQSGQPNHGLVIATDAPFVSAAREATAGLALALGVQQPLDDPLTAAVLANADELRFLNHTFTHRDMDASNNTGFAEAYSEIRRNMVWWDALGLPGLAENRATVVTGQHSGLSDDQGTFADLSDDVAFPTGANPALLDAAERLGIRYLASDVSRPGQQPAAFIDDRDVVILPRYPTGVFFNTRTPLEMADEYNWIFNESYLEAGEDPCETAGAACQPLTYGEILDAEAVLGLRHLLEYRPWPHYFHITNIVDYDGRGNTLLFDWLDAVLDLYDDRFTLPISSPDYADVGRWTEQRLALDDAQLDAVLDPEAGTVTLRSDRAVTVEVTGALGGQIFGSRPIARVALSGGAERTLEVVDAPVRSAPLIAVAELDAAHPVENRTRSRLELSMTRQALLQFDLDGLEGQAGTALLTLPDVRMSGGAVQLAAELCRVAEVWDAESVTWSTAIDANLWASSGGASVDASSCVGANLVHGTDGVFDISAMVEAWSSGTPNHGVVVRAVGPSRATFAATATDTMNDSSASLVTLVGS